MIKFCSKMMFVDVNLLVEVELATDDIFVFGSFVNIYYLFNKFFEDKYRNLIDFSILSILLSFFVLLKRKEKKEVEICRNFPNR